MASLNNPVLKEVFAYLDSSFSQAKNSIIITIPGLGISHILKQYSTLNKVNYVDTPDSRSGLKNIIDIDFQKNLGSIEIIDKYYRAHRSISPKNTFVFVINTPNIIHSEDFQKSYFASHSYDYYYFRPWAESELSDFVSEQNLVLSTTQLSKLHQLSGGIVRLAKYLLFHLDLLNLEDFVQLKDSNEFIKLMHSTFETISFTPLELLTKLGLYKDGKFTSTIINWFFENKIFVLRQNFDIKLMPDLSFYENTKLSAQFLTKFEKDLLEFLLNHENIATRDQISETKWGKDSFEKFSDQAINKAISRLNEKLSSYEIKAINKVGYKLMAKNA